MSARDRLIEAATHLVRRNGFGGTSIDALCFHAGVTKGAFFHHFASKDALGVAAAAAWTSHANALFGAGAWHADPDPLARIFGYLDFRAELIAGTPASFTCLAGTMVQEVHESSPTIRDACRQSIFGHAETLAADFDDAITARGITGVTGVGLAQHVQAVLQGGFIMAKAANDTGPARDALAHLRRYLMLLFNQGEAA